MNGKVIVLVAVAGTAILAQAGFGDFLRKAAAVSDIVTGSTNATAAVTSGQQTVDEAKNSGQTATSAAQPVTTAVAEVEDAATPGEVTDIEMEELAKRLKKNSSLLVIDVRTKAEYAAGHIPGAKNIPVGSISAKIGKVAANKTTPIYVYCESGSRSATAAEMLVAKGYKYVYDAGAIDDWPGKLSK